MSKLIQEYELLVKYLKEMIADGCQIIHGGNLMDWNDTIIPKIINRIDKFKDKELEKIFNLEVGDQLKHRLSSQNMTIVEIDDKTISVNPSQTPLKYQLNEFLEEFLIIKKVKKKPASKAS